MAKLYTLDLRVESADYVIPKCVMPATSPREAGVAVYKMEDGPDFDSVVYLLLNDGVLYRYVSAEGGFGWERIDGEPDTAPAFAV